MSSAFTPEQWAYLEAHKNDSRVHEIRWCYSVPIPVSILSTAFRLWAKKAGRNGIRLDDYLIIFATVCFALSMSLFFLSAYSATPHPATE